MAKAPGFCNAVLSGPYSHIGAEKMCAKELSVLAAFVCSQYHAGDDDLKDDEGNSIPHLQQCFS